MSLVRGDFKLVCDTCRVEVGLETRELDEAIELKKEYMEDNGWSTLHHAGRYADLCGNCL